MFKGFLLLPLLHINHFQTCYFLLETALSINVSNCFKDMLPLVWNCRSLKKRGVATFIKNLIAQYSFHFIGIQETMIEFCDEKISRKFDHQKDHLWLSNPSKGKSGGILVGIRLELYDVGSFTQGEFMIQVNLWDKSIKKKMEPSYCLWCCSRGA